MGAASAGSAREWQYKCKKRNVGEGQVCEASEVRKKLGLKGRGLDWGRWDQVKSRTRPKRELGKEVLSGCLSENDIRGLWCLRWPRDGGRHQLLCLAYFSGKAGQGLTQAGLMMCPDGFSFFSIEKPVSKLAVPPTQSPAQCRPGCWPWSLPDSCFSSLSGWLDWEWEDNGGSEKGWGCSHMTNSIYS